jgi:hypothetical protein
VIETPARAALYELPERASVEVPLEHPEYGWFAELGLRWHAVPAISNMRLTIGGVHYPLAPFNGWYMGTEIGARNLADADRYDLLPVVAARLGLDTSREHAVARPGAGRAEPGGAVVVRAGRREDQRPPHRVAPVPGPPRATRSGPAGRVPADWTWIVPPMSGAATPVFHRYYHEADQRPNFYLDVVQQTRTGKGNALACGFAACTGDIIVMIDADGSTDPAEIPLFVDALVAGADFAKGSRFGPAGTATTSPGCAAGQRGLNGWSTCSSAPAFTDLCYGYNAFWRTSCRSSTCPCDLPGRPTAASCGATASRSRR